MPDAAKANDRSAGFQSENGGTKGTPQVGHNPMVKVPPDSDIAKSKTSPRESPKEPGQSARIIAAMTLVTGVLAILLIRILRRK